MDGTTKLKEVILNKTNDWKHTFENLFVFDQKDGHKIDYRIKEEKKEGYDTSITGNAKDGFTVTNTKKEHEIEDNEADLQDRKSTRLNSSH